jgi:hypothetical protein
MRAGGIESGKVSAFALCRNAEFLQPQLYYEDWKPGIGMKGKTYVSM